MGMYKLSNYGTVDKISDGGAGVSFDPKGDSSYAMEYAEWLSIPGNTPDPADPVPPPPPFIVYKEKNSIIKQIIAAGRMAQARAVLASPGMEDSKDLWDGAYKIAYDDAMVRQLLTTIGMNAETVMASATTFGSDAYAG